jgi:hypothetical protein
LDGSLGFKYNSNLILLDPGGTWDLYIVI